MLFDKHLGTRVLIAASLVALPSAVSAQDNAAVGNETVNSTVTTDTIDPAANGSLATAGTDPLLNETAPVRVREEDDNDFPWGLLGLLGLAGLLGRKKKDDIHVDARNDPRKNA
jgi:hypothetical protein